MTEQWSISNCNRTTDKYIRHEGIKPRDLVVVHRGVGRTEREHREFCERIIRALNAADTGAKP